MQWPHVCCNFKQPVDLTRKGLCISTLAAPTMNLVTNFRHGCGGGEACDESGENIGDERHSHIQFKPSHLGNSHVLNPAESAADSDKQNHDHSSKQEGNEPIDQQRD